ncbi:hypothetical protein BaRGS_00009875 [Batillaria attramentaria]|uniref:Uncharacterized protein n=1 Tax=Batillaria attramentaria TaxID=370345 RepID=A0ABD0LI62_9CAEN
MFGDTTVDYTSIPPDVTSLRMTACGAAPHSGAPAAPDRAVIPSFFRWGRAARVNHGRHKGWGAATSGVVVVRRRPALPTIVPVVRSQSLVPCDCRVTLLPDHKPGRLRFHLIKI